MSNKTKKLPAIDAGTVLATKAAVSQRGGEAARQVYLNFKVEADFRRHFKRLALDADMNNTQLLRAAVALWEREQEKKPVRHVAKSPIGEV